MDLSEEWKSLFPISAVFRSPLLLSGPSIRPILGPLVFNPIPNTITCLFSSPSLLPPCSPLPHLSFPRFLLTSSSDSSLPPSASSSIASVFGPHHHQNNVASNFLNNRLELLRCPGTNNFMVFFPTGENSDQVGFLLLHLNNSFSKVRVDDNGDVFSASCRFNHQILRISVNPVLDSGYQFSALTGNSFGIIGYLLASTMYSIHWYVIKVEEIGSDTKVPSLTYIGTKVFKTCCIVHACWSPHIPEESIVLLESGALFLFDMESCLKTNSVNAYCKGTRLKVSWDDSSNLRDLKWLSFEFSWHPRILIVARSDAVFMVDLRLDECNLSCLAKVETLHMYASIGNERFLALSRAGPDGFHFALASDSLLLLCDVRKPMMPVLQWAHGLSKPCYIDVFRLSHLRSNLRDDMYKWASESGFCILVGSFWNCEFNLFCYGPSSQAPSGSIISRVTEFSKSYYAWERPSNLLLSGHECPCGSCLVKEEFLKDDLPAWIDWQRKKEVVLGFGIINNDLSAFVSKPDEFGGFTLVRLLSSGKFESQRYSASWDSIKLLEEPHKNLSQFEDYLMCSTFDEEYKFPRRFNYLELDYLNGYLNGNLDEVVISKMKNPYSGPQAKESFTLEFHEILCEKLNACGLSRLRSSPTVTVVFNDISLPSSIHEVAFRRLWADLPVELLQLAFSNYSEFLEVLVDRKRVSLEFLVVPDQPQLPPFFLRKPSLRSNKWSQKVPRTDALVGPVLPLPVLLALHEFHNGCPNSEEESGGFTVETELRRRCNEVMQVAHEMAASNSTSEPQEDRVVSLADDREETWVGSQTAKPFFLHHPVAFTPRAIDHKEEQSVYKDEVFGTLISKVHEKEHASTGNMGTGLELFDSLCPIKLRFDDASAVNFGLKELKAYKLLKKQFSKWQGDFNLYDEFVSGSRLHT
ncbi:TATA box-binding protein associated factor RNA polymerase I subunit C [Trema orientale]|uniref:TATA box-binding protein associated factor RNA polymerase I subunit C n=1 Tax=Trema orientale TaxID=63057 RepID=A0A2P5FG95_TREOI|nr:TATA box-binding protein associated factor RNA polymerase I subunit C [Trema orientale]